MKNQKWDEISLAHTWENLKQPEEVDVYLKNNDNKQVIVAPVCNPALGEQGQVNLWIHN